MNQKIQFGKAIEYKIASEMLMEGYEIYLPAVDDHGVDIMARTPNGNIVEVQVKAMSKSGLFAAINYNPRPNFYFVFYIESQDKTWILSSDDFTQNASRNNSGKNTGKYSIDIMAKKNQQFVKTNYSSKII